MFGNPKVAKSSNFFYCKKCDYITSRKYNYEKHIRSDKHQNMPFGNGNAPKVAKVASFENPEHNNQTYMCPRCSKVYKDNSGLWKHKKKCSSLINDDIINITHNLSNTDNTANTIEEQKELIQYLLKENADFKKLMIEQNQQMMHLAKNVGNNNNNTSTINNNQQFNLQLYLNETCKNAMNIMDFVNQLHIENIDLEEKIGRAHV